MEDKSHSDSSLFNVPLNSESGSGSDLDFGEISLSSKTTTSPVSCTSINDADGDNPDEAAEKARLICQVLELQNTLGDLSQRVDLVKEENLKLKSENQVLGQYIENLMSSSSVFQNTNAKNKKK
ncbi:short coiled-coil protein B-like [Styela clava]|uniref:short coiled-coil protein B-like n=1 Tax=Styela clava TaxID=7725 RepID=UPI00193A549D|nr:short coiled-coil protein B-like [Styela clava]